MCAHGRREGKVGVSMGEATSTCLSQHVRRCAHAVLRGRQGTLGKPLKRVFLNVSEDVLMPF